MCRRPMQASPNVIQGPARVIRKSKHAPGGLKQAVDSLPRILCWKCRRLTSFELERCEHCGSAFAGSTGGAYGSGYKPGSQSVTSNPIRPIEPQSAIRSRTLREIVEDLRRVRDLADSPGETLRDDGEVSLLLYQCPSCGRFVSQAAEECACGVRFAAAEQVTFQCPECGTRSDIFGHGGARHEAERLGVPFLGEIPLHMSIRTTSDEGNPVVASEPDGPHAAIYRAIGTRVRDQLQGAIAAA